MTYTKAELYGNAKLTHEEVRAIRRRGAAREHPRDIARSYQVAPETIRKILRWDTYTMVPEEGPGELPPARQSPSSTEITASQARVLVAAGLAPSLEAALQAQALKEAAEPSPGLAKLQVEAGKSDALLAGLLDSNEVGLNNPGGKSSIK